MAAPHAYRILLLGAPAVERASGAPVEFRLGKPLALLAYLAMASGPVPRLELCGLLWGKSKPARARNSVRQALWLIRGNLGDGVLASSDAVQLRPGFIETDIARFEADLAAGRLDEAMERWRGPPLDGLLWQDAPNWESWLDQRHSELERRFVSALEVCARQAREDGNHAAALPCLNKAVEVQPAEPKHRFELVETLLDLHHFDLATAAISEAWPHFDEAADRQRLERLEGRLGVLRLAPGVSTSGPATPFVGRAEEYGRLVALWHRAAKEMPGTALVTGALGTGKSRLAGELSALARAEGGVAVTVRALEAERPLAWSVAADLVRALAGRDGSMGTTPASDVALKALVPTLNVPTLRTANGASPLPPDAALADAVRDLVGSVAHETPLLIVVDDFQWADAESRTLLSVVCRRLEEAPCLVLFLCEAGDGDAPLGTTECALQQVPGVYSAELHPFSESETAELLARTFENAEVVDRERLARRVHRATDGNPGRITGLIEALHGKDVLESDATGGWRIRADRFDWDLIPEPAPPPAETAERVEQPAKMPRTRPRGTVWRRRASLILAPILLVAALWATVGGPGSGGPDPGGLAWASVVSLNDAAGTTESPEAREAFLDGEQHLREYQYAEAVESFERALTHDSTFGFAAYRLGTAAEWVGDGYLASEAREIASRFSSQLPPRERLMMEAVSAYREHNPARALRLYRSYLEHSPDDIEALYWSAVTQLHHGALVGLTPEHTRARFERVLELEPAHQPALMHAVLAASWDGDQAALDSLVGPLMATVPPNHSQWPHLHALSTGDCDEVACGGLIYETLAEDTLWTLALNAALYTQNIAQSEEIARRLIEPERSAELRVAGHLLLSYLQIAQGRPGAAWRELDAVAPLDTAAYLQYRLLFATLDFLPTTPAEVRTVRDMGAAWDGTGAENPFLPLWSDMFPPIAEYLMGVLSARLGDAEAVEHHITSLEEMGGSMHAVRLNAQRVNAVRGRLAAEQGQPAAALALLGQTDVPQSTVPYPHVNPHQRHLRPRLLRTLGRTEDALRAYGALPWRGSFYREQFLLDLLHQAPFHFEKAELLEELGRPDEAAEHYARVVELWGDAEPELQPRVEECRRRLIALRGDDGG